MDIPGKYDFAARAARVNFLRDDAAQLIVLWKKAENMFASFYARLEELRPQIGDDLLNEWCTWNLGMGLETLNKATRILEETDADRIRESNRRARELAKQQHDAERAARQAEKAAEKAVKAAPPVKKAARTKTPSQPRVLGRPRKSRKRDSRDSLEAANGGGTPIAVPIAVRPMTPIAADADDLELANAMHADLARVDHGRQVYKAGRQEWAEATLGLADKMRRAKERYPAVKMFSEWLQRHNLWNSVITPNERHALIKMGRHLEEVREVLERTDSWSWELVWRNELSHLENTRKMEIGEPQSAAIH